MFTFMRDQGEKYEVNLRWVNVIFGGVQEKKEFADANDDKPLNLVLFNVND